MERLGERICSQPWVGALKDWFCSPSWVDVVCAPLTLWIVRWYVRNFEIANFCLYFTYSPGLNILLVMGMLLPIVVYIMRVFHL